MPLLSGPGESPDEVAPAVPIVAAARGWEQHGLCHLAVGPQPGLEFRSPELLAHVAEVGLYEAAKDDRRGKHTTTQ
jgi:hypothetical protein